MKKENKNYYNDEDQLIFEKLDDFKKFNSNISDKNKSVSSSHKIKGNREEIIQRSVNKAIWELINFVKNLY